MWGLNMPPRKAPEKPKRSKRPKKPSRTGLDRLTIQARAEDAGEAEGNRCPRCRATHIFDAGDCPNTGCPMPSSEPQGGWR